jgi:hypothetical protein
MGGKCYVYKRTADSKHWQAAAFIAGRNHRVSTKIEGLTGALRFTEEWYLELRGKHVRGELDKLVLANAEKTFREAAEQFLREFPIITEGQRSEIYVKDHERRVRNYLIPFFGDDPLSKVGGRVTEYRIDRVEKSKAKRGKPPARSTLHQEMVALRQTLKTANQQTSSSPTTSTCCSTTFLKKKSLKSTVRDNDAPLIACGTVYT